MKAELRRTLLAKRRAIDPALRQKAAEQAAKLFSAAHLFQESQHIACYLAQQEEFDCFPIIKTIWAAKKKCYLPIVSPEKENLLSFASYDPNDELKLNRYRILEPMNPQTMHPEQLDLVIAPLVGFDLHGNRLGMGGGYYDRTFAFLRGRSKKIHFFGLAYDIQQVAMIQHDPWDVPLDGVITNKEIIFFSA